MSQAPVQESFRKAEDGMDTLNQQNRHLAAPSLSLEQANYDEADNSLQVSHGSFECSSNTSLEHPTTPSWAVRLDREHNLAALQQRQPAHPQGLPRPKEVGSQQVPTAQDVVRPPRRAADQAVSLEQQLVAGAGSPGDSAILWLVFAVLPLTTTSSNYLTSENLPPEPFIIQRTNPAELTKHG